MNQMEAKLAELGLTLPEMPKPAANYLPYLQSDNLILISGQLPIVNGKPQFIGKVGKDLDVLQAQKAAQLCALNALSVLKEAITGNFVRVERCLRLAGFINATPDFIDHPKVMNGASDLIVAVLGERGLHARIAVGCASLPFGVAVEVEALFEIKI